MICYVLYRYMGAHQYVFFDAASDYVCWMPYLTQHKHWDSHLYVSYSETWGVPCWSV